MDPIDKIKEQFDFNCECGYSFKDFIDDVNKMPVREYLEIHKNKILICQKCKKKYPFEHLEVYKRDNKIRKICQNMNI